MTLREVSLAIEGAHEKRKTDSLLLRRATFIIAASGMNGKGVSAKMNKLWPVEGGDKSQVSDRARETLRKFTELDALNKVKKTLDGRRS